MYILYGGDFTRSTLVQWLLAEGGIAHEFRKVDIIKGEHRSPEFLAINPAGLVPVLITPEGEVLHEVAALMLYLADRHRLTELAPALDDPDRGPFLSAFFHVASDIQPDMKRFHFPHRFSLRIEDNVATQDLAKAMIFSRLAVMNMRLEKKGPYILGSRFSIADFYLCFWIAYLDRAAACAKFPAVARLYHLVRSRPGAQPFIAETEQAADAYAEMMRANPAGVIA